ncbi:MAG TPA: nucleotide exchange factor GrpE [Alphaproteobacteria bacterium]|nr:nucleotide exchange factor GrpE [Alphaproteobacteria bacterium]
MTEEKKVEVSEEVVEEVEATSEEVVTEKSEVEVLAEENTELKNKVLKAMAETENLRKRHQRELADANKYAATKFAKEMLAVQDNMLRALESLDKVETQDEHLKGTLEGIKMVSSQLENSFTQAGIEKIKALGEKLNPELHQAMAQVESEAEAGTIIEEFQSGYTIHGRVLRPSMVVIAK